MNREAARYQTQFQSMRQAIAQIAATAYEEGNLTSPAALLTSGDPQQILNQSSILLELSANNSAAMNQFLAAARQLDGAQQAARRVEAGMLALKKTLGDRQQSLNQLRAQEETLLAQLTPAQQAAASPGTGGSGSGPAVPAAPDRPAAGPDLHSGEKAVSFAYAQIGKPYVWGATGPDSASTAPG